MFVVQISGNTNILADALSLSPAGRTVSRAAPDGGQTTIARLDTALGALAAHADNLDQSSVAPGTRSTYSSGQTELARFCSKFHLEQSPASSRTLELFVAHLSQQGRRATTIKVFLAAVCHQRIQRRLPTNSFSYKRISAAIAGRERIKAMADVSPSCGKRHAASLKDLRSIKDELMSAIAIGAADRLKIWAAVTLGFFIFLSSSEYLSPARWNYHRQRTLQHWHLEIQRDNTGGQDPKKQDGPARQGSLGNDLPLRIRRLRRGSHARLSARHVETSA